MWVTITTTHHNSNSLLCKLKIFIALCSTALGKSLMYTRNNNGPKIEPCSILYFILVNFETVKIKVRMNVLNSLISGRDSSVGIATRYGLDGPGSNPGGGEIFRTRPDRPWGPPGLLYNGYQVFSRV